MKLNHVLVRTSDLTVMSEFITNVIGLEQGHRPPFPFRGAWFYSNGQPVVHVLEDRSTDASAGAVAHVAFDGANYDDLVTRLKKYRQHYDEKDVPQSGERQIFVSGPDGFTVEMLFPPGSSSNGSFPYQGVSA